MGRLAADMLLNLLDGHQALPSELVLSAELLVRESCGAVADIKSGITSQAANRQ